MRIDQVIVIGASGGSGSDVVRRMSRQFGARLVMDSWDGVEPIPPGALVLVRDMPIVPPPHTCVMTFESALEETAVRLSA